MNTENTAEKRPNVLAELGFRSDAVDGEVRGQAAVVPEMFVPGTTSLRISVLLTWADIATGIAAMHAMAAIPVTLELDVHLYREPCDLEEVRAVARLIKAGRSVTVSSAEFVAGDGTPLALAQGSFMRLPKPNQIVPPEVLRPRAPLAATSLTVPLAIRARCTREAPGVAVLPLGEDRVNLHNTLNGGLIGLPVEEAVLSLSPPGTVLSSMTLRYLYSMRVGPAVATAEVHSGLARFEVREGGADDRLSVIGTARAFARCAPG